MSLDRNEVNTDDELKSVPDSIVSLQSPWVEHWWLVKTMFKNDDDIKIEDIEYLDDGKYEANIIVKDENKAAALNDVLCKVNEFGNVTLTFNIFANMNKQGDSNGVVELDDYKKLFNEKIADQFIELQDIFGNYHYFVVFKREVVSFYNDDLTDPWGMWNGLYQNIAEKIFVSSNVMFSTAPEDADTAFVIQTK